MGAFRARHRVFRRACTTRSCTIAGFFGYPGAKVVNLVSGVGFLQNAMQNAKQPMGELRFAHFPARRLAACARAARAAGCFAGKEVTDARDPASRL
ncbi:hypothetical protein J1C52_07975 [Roseibaca sp. Y0-43]|nr:hypothetical protein [Roseibaca sp. Y0-43]